MIVRPAAPTDHLDAGPAIAPPAAPATRPSSGAAILKGPDVRAAALWVQDATGEWRRAVAADPQSPVHHPKSKIVGRVPRSLNSASEEASRILAQAQVELGRARAEAERLRRQAETRLAEVEETITTAAEARALLKQSQTEGAETIARAQEEAKALFAAARTEGFEQGQRAGRDEGMWLASNKLSHELELAHTIAAQAKVDRERLIMEAEPAIVRLALDVARKVIAREIEADPDIMRGLVTRAMLKSSGDDRIRLRLHPATIGRLGEYLTTVAERFAARGVDVVPDPTLDESGVVIDTRAGRVDASADTQVAKIERSLLSLTGASA